MALDDDGMKNQYLTKLRVKIREDSDIMRELTEMLQDFALSYNAELNSAGNVDQYNPRAQEFLEAWEALRQDFDVWVGQISFADVLELQAMWNNREIWPRRLARLPSIAPPRVDEEQEPTPEMPPIMPGMPSMPAPSGKGMAPKGLGEGAPSAPTVRTAREILGDGPLVWAAPPPRWPTHPNFSEKIKCLAQKGRCLARSRLQSNSSGAGYQSLSNSLRAR